MVPTHFLYACLPPLPKSTTERDTACQNRASLQIGYMWKSLLSHFHLLTDGDNEIQTLEASMMTAGRLTATCSFPQVRASDARDKPCQHRSRYSSASRIIMLRELHAC
jgi:hypothetical protein